MQRRFAVFFILVSIGCSSAARGADDGGGAKADLAITSVMRDLGVFELIRDIPQILTDGMEQRRIELDAAAQDAPDLRRMERIARETFTEAAMAERIRSALRTTWDPSRYQTIQRLLQSSAGKRLVQARREGFAPAAAAEIRRIAGAHDESKIDRARVELLQKLDDLSADTELFVAVQALSIHALTRMVAAQERTGGVASEAEQEMMLQRTYDQLIRPSRFTTAMTYTYAFRAMSNDEIQQFVDIYDFTDVHWFVGQLMDALRTAMEQATREAEARLARTP